MLFCPKILIFTSNILIELNRLPSVFYGVCLKVVCFPMQNCHLVDLAVSHWDRGSIWIRVNLPSWHVRPPYEWKTAAKQRCCSHATTLREDFFLPAHQSIVSDSDPSPTREIWLWRACTFVSSPTKENPKPKDWLSKATQDKNLFKKPHCFKIPRRRRRGVKVLISLFFFA